MSFSVIRSVTKVANKLLTECVRQKSSVAKMSSMFLYSRVHQIGANRPFTRSLWYMCNKSQSPPNVAGASARKTPGWSMSCGCGMHTEGDMQLVQFLKEEIKLEKNSQTKVPTIPGWEATLDGSDVVLKRQHDNETIVVKFNVNNSVDSEGAEAYDASKEDQESQMVSLPPFSVEISKGGENTLTMHCSFPASDDMTVDQEEQPDDPFEIEEISLSRGEANEQTYTLSASVMDGNLYDLLMNTLDERGVDEEFTQKLIDFSTSYEHKCYVNFLETLQNFVVEK